MEQRITTIPAHTIGLDLGDKFTAFHVLDEAGETLELGRVKTSVTGLARLTRSYPEARIVLEVGPHSGWVSRAFLGWGHSEVLVANVSRVPGISRSSRKTDGGDAEHLARLGRTDPRLLYPVQLRSRSTQLMLTQLRSRRALVEARTKLINAVRGMSKGFGIQLKKCSAACFHRRTLSQLPEDLVPAVHHLVAAIAMLTIQIRRAERDLERIAHDVPAVAQLRQVPGVGLLTALAYVLTIEDPHRFACSRKVGSYIGLTRRLRISSGQDPQLGISKAGSADLRALLTQSAHYILGPFGPDTALRAWGLAVAERRGKKTAITAVARKLAILLHRLWITGDTYEAYPGRRAAA